MNKFKPNRLLPEAPVPPPSEISPLAKIRGLLGYVEDSSSTSITISQDDATNYFTLHVRYNKDCSKVYYAKSLKGVIDRAYKDEGEPK